MKKVTEIIIDGKGVVWWKNQKYLIYVVLISSTQ